jgi:tRNA modification GTPase
MVYDPNDTIAAIATAPGGAARGMIRLSGPQAAGCLDRLFRSANGDSLESITRPSTIAGQVNLDLGGELRQVPCDLLLWPTCRSYTREPVAEIHTLGSPPIVEALLETICRSGARLAEPGEFTLRAFLAGRLDLTQAEAVLGVIDARGQEELDGALAQLAGGLAQPLSRLRNNLLQLLAELEAGLDFVEEDIEFIAKEELSETIVGSIAQIRDIAEQMAGRGDALPLEQVVLLGAPNAGKSSLFNALAARWEVRSADARRIALSAIVSDQQGTTLDYLITQLDMDGQRFQMVDTAGIIEDRNVAIEEEYLPAFAAQSMMRARREGAQLRLWCIEASDFEHSGPRELREVAASKESLDMIVLTKIDLCPEIAFEQSSAVPMFATSCVTGEGIETLSAAIRSALSLSNGSARGHVVATTAARCRESLRHGEEALVRAVEIVESGGGEELTAAEVRLALNELGKVVGAVYTDDVLDRIFSTFCIGK